MTQAEDGCAKRLLLSLGWRHHGFRVVSEAQAVRALLWLLVVPFLINQITALRQMRSHPSQIEQWCTLAVDFESHPVERFYEGHSWYLYSPFFLSLVRPLAFLPDPAMVIVFQTLRWIALFACLRLAWRMCSPPGEDLPVIVTLGSLLLSGRFLWNDMAHMNVNVFVLLAILYGCRLMSSRHEYAAGAVVAVAACVKVTPAIVLLYFVYKGWWRSLVGAVAAGIVCLLLVPAIWVGWSANWTSLVEWYRYVIVGFVQRGEVLSGVQINLSLPGLIDRLLGPVPAVGSNLVVTVVELPDSVRRILRNVLAVVTLLALAGLCRRRVNPAEKPLVFSAEMSMVIVTMVLFSGITWTAHLVVLLLPFSVLLAYLADARYTQARRAVHTLTWVAAVLCLLTTDILGPTIADYVQACGGLTLGVVAAGAGTAVIRFQQGNAH